MLYVLQVIVEVNVVDDVMSVHVMHLEILHGLRSTVSRLDADEWGNIFLTWTGCSVGLDYTSILKEFCLYLIGVYLFPVRPSI